MYRIKPILVFDSSSKLQSGILIGNLVEYGSFKQCLSIYKQTQAGSIRGKHCSFRIIPGEKILRAVTGFRNVSKKVKTSLLLESLLLEQLTEHKISNSGKK